MPNPKRATETVGWTPRTDPKGMFSSGIPDLDRVLGGGFRRGSFALYHVDELVAPDDLRRLFTPTWLNFLYQSRGLIAVLPARETAAGFRAALLDHVSRRLFDSRVRVVTYAGEDESAPYIVSLRVGGAGAKGSAGGREESMNKMERAERAARGAGPKPIIEFTSLEVLEVVAGAETAARMYFHGVKRVREVGNLGLGVARPGLACVDAVRSMMDYEFQLRRTTSGLLLSGIRPAFAAHLVVPDLARGRPHIALVPAAA